MLKNKWLALFVIASFLTSFISFKASAETAFQAEKFPFKEMQVQVMPEFDYPEDWGSKDTPSLLVGQYGTIANKSGQDYEGEIEIPVPAMEKGFEAYLVAEFPEENKPEVQRPYDVDKEKGIVTWKPAKAIKNNETYKFVIEYYTKSIDVKDKKRFTYQLVNNADIDQLDVVFYAPMEAKEIKLEPKAESNTKSEYGEELYYYQYKNVKAGDNLNYSFSYKKEGTESTLEAINKKQPPNDENHSGVTTATDQVTKGGTDNSKRPIIGVGGASIIGIALIIAGLFVFLGLKGNAETGLKAADKDKKTKQQSKQTTGKKDIKSANTEEKKELRKKLLTGKIDQEMYEEEIKKLI
ncbi:hypothetical protein BABA_07871 [Neobacillus bataviensis LMG 21833]|uniref:SHOCT domain-containing protein n=1 Tax=Neobacillus bataviensis LMG 21833 TaxID=1117379 RepID=K6DBD8_9BACI|nr:hypothetical protein [Neobacillus bataviensis]EKN69857.1 hypothetical protein BABA_07871 [Neobacillus bataviensis LMG 21833]